MFEYDGGDGVEQDIFCHLIDAWVEGTMERSPEIDVDKACDTLEPFRKAHGDRFANADALCAAIEKWRPKAKTRGRDQQALTVLADLLAMWRSIEAAVEGDQNA